MTRLLATITTRLHTRERGATAVEYGLLVALIAAVIVAIVLVLGRQVSTAFQSVSERSEAALRAGRDDDPPRLSTIQKVRSCMRRSCLGRPPTRGHRRRVRAHGRAHRWGHVVLDRRCRDSRSRRSSIRPALLRAGTRCSSPEALAPAGCRRQRCGDGHRASRARLFRFWNYRFEQASQRRNSVEPSSAGRGRGLSHWQLRTQPIRVRHSFRSAPPRPRPLRGLVAAP